MMGWLDSWSVGQLDSWKGRTEKQHSEPLFNNS